MPDSKSDTTAECGWAAYEKQIYAEVAHTQKRDRIAAVIGACVDANNLPSGWPGSVRIANAIMKELAR